MTALGGPSFRADSVPQDWAALSAWLCDRGMALDAGEPRQFANGLANLNYLISVDGRPMVLRRPPGGQLAEGASDMKREFRALSRLHVTTGALRGQWPSVRMPRYSGARSS